MIPDLVVTRWGARFMGRRMPVSIGRGGVVPEDAKREGDGATPAGRYAALGLYWRADRLRPPAAALAMRPAGPRDGWSDDPACPRYNRAVRLPSRFSAERMRRGDRLYDLVLVIDHNAEGAPGRGSAVFVHLRRSAGARTAGCLGFRLADLRWILERWTPRSRVVIRR